MIASAIALSIAALIAGHPVQVACDVPETAVVSAYSVPARDNVIHLKGSLCSALAGPVTSLDFSEALGALAHEAAHERGISEEACAERWADVTALGILYRFYGLRWGSQLALSIQGQMIGLTLRRPVEYHWTVATCSLDDDPALSPIFYWW